MTIMAAADFTTYVEPIWSPFVVDDKHTKNIYTMPAIKGRIVTIVWRLINGVLPLRKIGSKLATR